MKKSIAPTLLSLIALAFAGCSGQDPGQPAVGSISVKSRGDVDGIKLPRKPAKNAPEKG